MNHEKGEAQQRWRSAQYARYTGVIADLATDLIDLLDPQPGQKVLDVGCGDGAFSNHIRARGAEVVGIDPAPDLVRSARLRGIEAHVCAAQDFTQQNVFDKAVSNAVFHWILAPRPALEAVFRALRPGGRFVGELGGEGNIASVMRILEPLLAARGIEFAARNPWNFPSAESWKAELEATGFEIEAVELFERPTPLPTSFGDWIDTFANVLLAGLDASARSELEQEAEAAGEQILRQPDGTWVLDYVRLRFIAIKPRTSQQNIGES